MLKKYLSLNWIKASTRIGFFKLPVMIHRGHYGPEGPQKFCTELHLGLYFLLLMPSMIIFPPLIIQSVLVTTSWRWVFQKCNNHLPLSKVNIQKLNLSVHLWKSWFIRTNYILSRYRLFVWFLLLLWVPELFLTSGLLGLKVTGWLGQLPTFSPPSLNMHGIILHVSVASA